MYKQKMIVVATMVLHSYICEHGGEDIDFDWFDRNPNYIPTIPERYNKYAVSPWRPTGLLRMPMLQLWMYFMMSWPPPFLMLGTS